ncbi:outer membrane protein assembly factor BamB family protein [Planctobacterium marinum]|uniref:outer membrane protein assembly factor BamB family protein n=1 Tax=Planctobacterium marinum TaxID=1631968 RepID=UPI001E5E504D|nr:PQQ-binding-like beta-propeller repeat protein [Planctobacterium marinum]MCC2604815.1 PQQ-binding-like beta-propeller repeat protein [Planctobacterium marinum]
MKLLNLHLLLLVVCSLQAVANPGSKYVEQLIGNHLTSPARVSPQSNREVIQSDRDIWRVSLPVANRLISMPVLDQEGNSYFGTDLGKLYSISPEGDINWEIQTEGRIYLSPVIGTDETLYFHDVAINDEQSALYAFNTDGTEKWIYVTSGLSISAIAIAKDGTLYFTTDEHLIALRADGTERWKYASQSPFTFPIVGDDGTIYMLGKDNYYLEAISPEGQSRWQFDLQDIFKGSPSIGIDGNIYIGSERGYLYAVSPEGELVWRIDFSGQTQPTVDVDGTIYVGDYGGTLYALNPDGSEKWQFQTEGIIFSSPLIGNDGTLYFTSLDNHVYAINRDGVELWRYETEGDLILSPSLDNEGRLIVANSKGTIIALQTDSQGLAQTPWPKYRSNNQNTGAQIRLVETNSFNPPLDYDGDGKADLIVRRPNTSMQYVLNSSDGEIQRHEFGFSVGDIPISGDFDGDGITDIAVRRASNKYWYIRNSSGIDPLTQFNDGITRFQFGLDEEDIPVPADYDGDGITDIAVRRPGNFMWYIHNSSGVDELSGFADGISRIQFALNKEDIPVVADYDGDGKADIAVRRPSNQYWYIRNSSGVDALSAHDDGISRYRFGARTEDIPVTGDFDGDGKADLAVRRPSTQTWYVLNSSGSNYNSEASDGIQRVRFGLDASDIPVVADYDGDGISDFAVRRASNQYFYIKGSYSDDILRQNFGKVETDIPVAAPIAAKVAMVNGVN